jgi:hypothetical protein
MKIAKLVIGTLAALYALAQLLTFLADLAAARIAFDSANAYGLIGGRLLGFTLALIIAILCFRKAGAKPALKEVSSSDSFAQTLAVIQLFVCFLPFLGVITSSAALALNWKKRGWAKITSWIGASISLLITAAVIFCLILAAMVKK